MAFREGWYLIRMDQRDRKFCRYFRTPGTYVSECVIEPNGEQILLWHAQTEAHAKQMAWSAEFEPLRMAAPGDWWDDPGTSAGYDPDLPGDHSRARRQPTTRELCMRARHVDPDSIDGLVCNKDIHVALFFDGTNNNMERDKPLVAHSNIVSLYEAHRDDRKNYFAYYIPGVGTVFREVGELTESTNGKAFAAGGEARIHWAMLLVYNAVCAAATDADLMTEAEMTPLVTRTVGGLKTWWRGGDAKLRPIFSDIDARLRGQIEHARPRIKRVHLSVFGFSRGAAQARAFCNWFQQATQGQVGGAAVRLRFLGVFDTVASVGLADSGPVGTGFMDWANGTMEIAGVDSGLHFVAAHEIRRSFPLSTARGSRGTPVAGMREFIYPGAHSDIGGGYAPGDQGKALGGRSQLLSQIALNDMYFGAINAGVELRRKNQMLDERPDFEVEDSLDDAFSAYARWTAAVEEKTENVAGHAKAHVGGRMQYHTQLYWRWRLSKRSDEHFRAMHSYANANAQDRQDLWDAEGDWRSDVERARRAVARPSSPKAVRSPAHVALHAIARNPGEVPADVDVFFDRFVHDSHAGFWLLGPQTAYDRSVFLREVRGKQASYDRLMQMSRETANPQFASQYLLQAQAYRLNNFERRVLPLDPDRLDEFPVMSDADVADLRRSAGLGGVVVKYLMGSGTRREANGHGQYRRIFDTS